MRKEPGKAPDWTPEPSPAGRIGVALMRAGRAVLVERERRIRFVDVGDRPTHPVHRAGARGGPVEHPRGQVPSDRRERGRTARERSRRVVSDRRERTRAVPGAARGGAEAVPEPALRERSGLRTRQPASQALYSNRGGLA